MRMPDSFMARGRLCEPSTGCADSLGLDPPLVTWKLLEVQWTATSARELSVWRACYHGKESGLKWLVNADMVQEVGLVRVMQMKLRRRMHDSI